MYEFVSKLHEIYLEFSKHFFHLRINFVDKGFVVFLHGQFLFLHDLQFDFLFSSFNICKNVRLFDSFLSGVIFVVFVCSDFLFLSSRVAWFVTFVVVYVVG